MDYSTPGSSVHGISQATILEWLSLQGIFLTHELSFSSPGESSWPSDQTRISCIGRWTLTTEPSDNPHFGPCLVFKIYSLWQCPQWDISTSSYELICKIYVSMDMCIIPRGTSVPVWDCNGIHISFVALITLLQFLADFPSFLLFHGWCSSTLFQSLHPPSRPKFHHFYSATCCFISTAYIKFLVQISKHIYMFNQLKPSVSWQPELYTLTHHIINQSPVSKKWHKSWTQHISELPLEVKVQPEVFS